MKKQIMLMIAAILMAAGVWGWILMPAGEPAKPVESAAPFTGKGVYVGIFREGAPRNMGFIKKYTEEVGKKPALIMWYLDWEQKFPADEALNVVEYGAMPHIVWEPWLWSDHEKIHLQDIIDGTWDEYIRTWAKEIKKFGHPVMLRMAHEFNIEGYPWGVINNSKDPEEYIRAFRHVVDIFKQEEAVNAKWVWCFMNYSHPDEDWNDWTKAYPGNDYVDWIGIDGYNWGNTQSWSDWQSFAILFRDQVRVCKKTWPTKPIMIAEFASAAQGGDKAAWIRELPGYLKSSMRGIDLIIWFDTKKETDWRLRSSGESLDAYKEIMALPMFLTSGTDLSNLQIAGGLNEKKVAIAVKAAGPVTIDGDLADWQTGQPLVMKDDTFFKEGTSWSGLDDLSGQAHLMWDSKFLYLAAEVTDDVPLKNSQKRQDIWNGDAIELVIGFTGKEYQLGFSSGDGKNNKPIIWNWQRRREPDGSQIAVVPATGGYIIEAKIPWAFFKSNFVPARGKKLPFDIAFDDADESAAGGGGRERQFIWNGDFNFYKDPSVWGVLELN